MVAALAAHPNVMGMKDSGGNPTRMAELAAATPEGFLLYAGSSPAITLSITAGASGTIAASANHLPELVAEVVRRARRSARSAASAQRTLSTAARSIEQYLIPGTKAAARLAGLRSGSVRRPLQRLTRTQLRVVEKAWTAATMDPAS